MRRPGIRLSFLLFFTGIGCILTFLFMLQSRRSTLAFSQIPADADAVIHKEIMPLLLEYPDLSLSLPVIAGRFSTGTWPVTDKGVTYLEHTVVPGEKGNSVLYGHNWPSLLQKLPQAQKGQVFAIRMSDGSRRVFRVASTSVVSPDQLHILRPTDDRRVTLYTCTGLLDLQRFVVVGILDEGVAL